MRRLFLLTAAAAMLAGPVGAADPKFEIECRAPAKLQLVCDPLQQCWEECRGPSGALTRSADGTVGGPSNPTDPTDPDGPGGPGTTTGAGNPGNAKNVGKAGEKGKDNESDGSGTRGSGNDPDKGGKGKGKNK